MNNLQYLGAAYVAVWLLIFLYARRLTGQAKRLNERLDALESRHGQTERD